ncbi:hypothetical protein VPH35_035376 [Triticum aestivum]
MYLAAYNPIIFPVPGQDLWPKTNSRDIEPPVFKDKPRKKQTKRRRSQFEPPAPKDTSMMASITCNNCQLVGHRYTSCKQTLKPGLALRKNKHQSNNTEEGSTQGSRAPTAPRGSTSGAPRGAPRGSTSGAPRGAPRVASSTTPAPRVTSSTAPGPRAASSTAGAATRAASSTAARRASSATTSRRGSIAAAATTAPFLPPRQRKQPSRLKDYFYASGN